jgi:hypothetical protein
MTRLELLTIVVSRARSNGFEFRRWYTSRLGVPWISAEAALALLDQQRRYYALLFSHEFALTFWKPGADITFSVPAQVFQRVLPNGEVGTVTRKGFMRRSSRPDAWRYHLRQMALAEEPLRYLRRYLNIEEDTIDENAPAGSRARKPKPSEKNLPNPKKSQKMMQSVKTNGGHAKPLPRPLPTGLPAFLRRPYLPSSDSKI